MTLRVFRLRLEAGETDYDKDDWGGCGCFAPIAQERMEVLVLMTEVKRPVPKAKPKPKQKEAEKNKMKPHAASVAQPLWAEL